MATANSSLGIDRGFVIQGKTHGPKSSDSLTRIDFEGGRAYPYKVKVREVVRMLEDDGWLLVRTRGSHHQYKHPTKPGLVTIPGNRNDELAPGTLNSILKQAGLKP